MGKLWSLTCSSDLAELEVMSGARAAAIGTSEALYFVSFTGMTLFTNTKPAKHIANNDARHAHLDNLDCVGGRLVLAGQRTDVCPRSAENEPCMGGYFVSSVTLKRSRPRQ